MQLLRKSRRHP